MSQITSTCGYLVGIIEANHEDLRRKWPVQVRPSPLNVSMAFEANLVRLQSPNPSEEVHAEINSRRRRVM